MVSLKCIIKYAGLPLRATFKLLHILAFVLLHVFFYKGMRFQLVHFQDVHMALFGHTDFYLVDSIDFIVASLDSSADRRCSCGVLLPLCVHRPWLSRRIRQPESRKLAGSSVFSAASHCFCDSIGRSRRSFTF